jgi:hypothetical protein
MSSVIPPILTTQQGLRENVTACTCNRRHPKTFITSNFPSYTIETGFSETDTLWAAGMVESASAQVVRRKQALDDIFASDMNTFVSLTTHSGFVTTFLSLINYPNPSFPLGTGQAMALLVKGEKVDGTAPVVTVAPPANAPHCAATCI